MASKGLALPRRRGSTLAHGCGRGGSGSLPLASAAAVSTGARGTREKRGPELDRRAAKVRGSTWRGSGLVTGCLCGVRANARGSIWLWVGSGEG